MEMHQLRRSLFKVLCRKGAPWYTNAQAAESIDSNSVWRNNRVHVLVSLLG